MFPFAISRAFAATINVNLPGASSATSPGGWVEQFYQFALMIAGVLAFGVIIYGGIRYMTSVGNPSGEEEAKQWIWAALTGVLLLAGAYIILNIINPQLLNLTLPKLAAISTPASVAAPSANNGSGVGGSSSPGACQTNSCLSGQTCTATQAGGTTTHTCLNNNIVQQATCAKNANGVVVCTGTTTGAPANNGSTAAPGTAPSAVCQPNSCLSGKTCVLNGPDVECCGVSGPRNLYICTINGK
jgi:hypothetical protein